MLANSFKLCFLCWHFQEINLYFTLIVDCPIYLLAYVFRFNCETVLCKFTALNFRDDARHEQETIRTRIIEHVLFLKQSQKISQGYSIK